MIGRHAATAYVMVAVVLIIAGCTPRQPAPRPRTSESGMATSATSPAPLPTVGPNGPTARSAGRPIEPVPSVHVAGMVAPPPGHGMARYTAQKITWKPCGVRGDETKQCATVLAPLDYRHPDREAITLAVARRPSPTAHPKGMIFGNPGGPGGSGIDFLDEFDDHGLNRSYDLVSWDPRGTGRSTPVRCLTDRQMDTYAAADYSPDTAQETQKLINVNTAFGRACLARSGELLEHISTADTVRDLDLLRRLFGQPRLNYFGFSYGTSIGAMYATMFGNRVARMVLDGATAVGGLPQVSQEDGFDRTLRNFAAWCAGRSCPLGSSQQQVLGTISGFLEGLDQKPLPVGQRRLTQSLGTNGLTYALYFPASDWRQLLEGLELAILAHDGSQLLRWSDALEERDNAGHYGQLNAAFPAILCLDEPEQGPAAELRAWRRDERRAPTLAPFIGPDLTCATWPVRSTDDTQRKISYTGKAPVVILGTTGDPATPYEYAEQMHKALASSRLITLDGDGHLAFEQSSCVQTEVLAYFESGVTPRDSRCTS